MSGRYLLDTNVAIAVLNDELDLESRRDSGQEAFLCATVVGELLFGAEKSSRRESNRARVSPIPENDLWIAASAVQHGLILATRDQHFGLIERLQVEAW